jgi:UDP-2,4-diacetamido-2,4,6-trideoxy-beta-L-altropyranose hydrolase
MRCLALAQAWQDSGGVCVFAMIEPPAGITARLGEEGIEVAVLSSVPGSDDDARQTVELAKERNAAWIVVDGYQFSGDYQQSIKASGRCLLVLDDYGHAHHYWADLVLNQNLGAEESLYVRREPSTRLLLGSRYALLRREFLKWQGWERTISPVARRVLVTLGGSDPSNATATILKAIGGIEIEGLEVVAVVGPANPHIESLTEIAAAAPASMRLEKNVADMPSLMAWADAAVGAAGSTSWERAFMGLSSLVVVLAANQEPLAKALSAAGVAGDLGSADCLNVAELASRLRSLMQSPTERREMARTGRQTIDGDGARRALMQLRDERLRLRSATAADCELVWRWANQPEVRARSFNSEPIAWDSHVAWFGKKLQDPGCQIFIGINGEDSPVGLVRFDACGPDAVEIGVSVSDEFRGQGLGAILLQSAVAELLRTTTTSIVYALIKPDNQASVRIFEKVGFRLTGTRTVANCKALEYAYSRGDIHAS